MSKKAIFITAITVMLLIEVGVVLITRNVQFLIQTPTLREAFREMISEQEAMQKQAPLQSQQNVQAELPHSTANQFRFISNLDGSTTYRDNKYGFELDIPASWVYDAPAFGGKYFRGGQCEISGGGGHAVLGFSEKLLWGDWRSKVIVYEDSKEHVMAFRSKSFYEKIKTEDFETAAGTATVVTWGSGAEITFIEKPGENITITFERKSILYREEDPQLVDKIRSAIASLRFIDRPVEQTQLDSFQFITHEDGHVTYRDNRYGFEVDIPAGWFYNAPASGGKYSQYGCELFANGGHQILGFLEKEKSLHGEWRRTIIMYRNKEDLLQTILAHPKNSTIEKVEVAEINAGTATTTTWHSGLEVVSIEKPGSSMIVTFTGNDKYQDPLPQVNIVKSIINSIRFID